MTIKDKLNSKDKLLGKLLNTLKTSLIKIFIEWLEKEVEADLRIETKCNNKMLLNLITQTKHTVFQKFKNLLLKKMNLLRTMQHFMD